ncbi:MAG: Yip1 family protein [Bacteroidales bacterium]
MNYKFIINRAKSLIITPRTGWNDIVNENQDFRTVIRNYLIYIALIPAFVNLIGYALVGYRVQFMGYATSFLLGLKLFVYFYIITLLAIYITTYIIDYFSKRFDAEKNFNKTFELITYSYTAIIFIGILNLSPAMSRMVSFLNLYCIYIFFFGFRKMTKIKPEKAMPYFIFNVVVIIAIYFFFWVWLKNVIIINHKSFNI